MKKINKKLFIAGLSVLLIGLFFYTFRPVIFQEGNPTPLIIGIVKLNLTDQKIVKLNMAGEKYLTKSSIGKKILIDKLNDQGYKFIEQMGSGYFFRDDEFNGLIATHKYYSRFFSLWSIIKSDNIKDAIEWTEYKNEKYGFAFSYPSLSIDNQLWGALPEGISIYEVLLPNQVLSYENNFYLHQKYKITIDWKTGKINKTENTFVPEYKIGNSSYPLPWHIVILEAKNENELDNVIKQKLGLGCSYASKKKTNFDGNYSIEINGDGKDLGSTRCPVNYMHYIVYSPEKKKAAFWNTGQECQIGLGFIYANCFDEEISNSFHFLD